MKKIIINGKFLSGSLNGVHRTAAHFSTELIKRSSPTHNVSIIAPVKTSPSKMFPLLEPTVYRGKFGVGQGWEMLTLPHLARDALLVNFCNLCPLLHRDSVVMIHDVQSMQFPSDYSRFQTLGYRLLNPLIGTYSKKILTVSNFSKESLSKNDICQPEKIEVVHNGTNHILDVTSDTDILSKHKLKPKGYILAIGSAKTYKNLRIVFEAMTPPLPGGIKLVVAGGPPVDHYLEMGWIPPKESIFTGFVTDSQLRALYEAAKVFVFPSKTEGFGLPPLEAMHCGTPVVASRAGAVPEICGDAAILVAPSKAKDWRNAILALSDSEIADYYTLTGKKRASEFSWDAAGDRLWEVLKPLAH